MRHYSRTEFEQVFDHMLGKRLAGALPQNIHEKVTIPRYEIGSRLQLGSKVYHYAYAGGILNPDIAVKVKNPQDVSQEILGAGATAGATIIVLTLDATDGPTYNGRLPANYLRGGYVVVFPAATQLAFTRGILSNTPITTAGGLTTVELDAPIPLDLTIADKAEAMASQYACVVPHADCVLINDRCATAGIATVPAVLGDYLWLQTWGPCWCAPGTDLCSGPNDRSVYFGADGGRVSGDMAGISLINQYCGFILANEKVTGEQGAPFSMLMIDP